MADQGLSLFHNRLRVLLNIDRDELVNAGVLAEEDRASWIAFRESPWRYLIRASDEDAEKMWALVLKRAPDPQT